MSDISSATRMNHAKEAMNKREVFEMRKMDTQLETDIKTVQETNVKQVDKLKKDYDVQFSRVKSENETKLIKLRNTWDKKIAEENNRYEKLFTDLKASQSDKLSTNQLNNDQQIAKQDAKHQEYLDKARLKFEEEKAKLEA